jgi:AmmeMemoRadiSam system protein B/AmmeMemoRadiSam system protein A
MSMSAHSENLQGATSAPRPAAVAGLFYPGDAAELRRELSDFLENSGEAPPAPGFPKALIVPHAGYVYSGAVAARAYDLLRPARGVVKRVVLLGPCHRVAVRGLALPGASAFATPLGAVPLDAGALDTLRKLPQVGEHAGTHAQEHALEVQLPFLQEVLGAFRLVPVVVGQASAEQVAEALEAVWGGPETLILVSSDLSHYHAYDEARAIDGGTVQTILQGSGTLDHEQACGATPIAGLLLAARRHGLVPRLIDYRNSGDTAGGRERVVGYASLAFDEGARGYDDRQGNILLALARASIGAALGLNAAPASSWDGEPWLRECRATFVTLTLEGNLRGCMGRLQAERPLGQDVIENARTAALSDPRFPPLGKEEFSRCVVEVSLLSTPKRLEFADHAGLIAQLEPHRDGLILECEGRRGTFLPQVWEALPDREDFIAHLKQKAGLPAGTRIERCKVLRYRALKWSEPTRLDVPRNHE